MTEVRDEDTQKQTRKAVLGNSTAPRLLMRNQYL